VRSRGRRWLRVRKLRIPSRVHRALKHTAVAVSPTAKAVADVLSRRPVAQASTAGANPHLANANDARSMRSRVVSFETGRNRRAIDRECL
jgi:hypothetical protein